jgi:hypothetical protein
MFRALGFSKREARLRTRIGIATTRGLLMDLLITGDRRLLDEAAELFGLLLSRPVTTT